MSKRINFVANRINSAISDGLGRDTSHARAELGPLWSASASTSYSDSNSGPQSRPSRPPLGPAVSLGRFSALCASPVPRNPSSSAVPTAHVGAIKLPLFGPLYLVVWSPLALARLVGVAPPTRATSERRRVARPLVLPHHSKRGPQQYLHHHRRRKRCRRYGHNPSDCNIPEQLPVYGLLRLVRVAAAAGQKL